MYPIPSERSAKSATVVPAVVVATITAQYKNGRNSFDAICAVTVTMKNPKKITELTAYPSFIVIDSASPPVSPSVVASTLITQNAKVTSGTLLIPLSEILYMCKELFRRFFRCRFTAVVKHQQVLGHATAAPPVRADKDLRPESLQVVIDLPRSLL
jgi:hypothetical protein